MPSYNQIKNITVCLIISLSIALLLTFLENKPFYQLLELKLFDLQMNLRTPPQQEKRILFVEMDEEAIDNLGRWPWPRNIFANIIDTLKSLGARQILFDVTFSQPTQIILEKEATDHIFEGKEQISEYIINETGALKSKETITAKDVIWTLEQIHAGFNDYTKASQQKLQHATIDNDEILSKSLKDTNSFIGYSFEILTDPRDAQYYEFSTQAKSDILAWLRKNPEGRFEDLPSPLIQNSQRSKTTLHDVFLRARISLLLEKNIEASLDYVSKILDMDPEKIRPDFNLAKNQFIKTQTLTFLEKNPKAKFIDIIFNYQIFDKTTQDYFKEVWEESKKEFEGAKKFGTPLSSSQTFFKAIKMDPPHHKFTEVIKNGGFLNGIPNDDGLLRFIPLFIQYKDNIFPHISIPSILDLTKPQRISFVPDKYFILHQATVNNKLKDIHVPIDKNGTMLINWAGRWKDSFRHISAAEIYRLYYLKESMGNKLSNSEKPSAQMKQMVGKEAKLRKLVENSICIIGLTATGTHDYNPIPYEATYPMVGTLGNVINTILTEQFINKVPDKDNTITVFILSVLIGLLLPMFSSLRGLIFTTLFLIGTFFVSLFLFNQGLWMNLASPMLLSLFSYLGITSYKFSTEEKDKRQIKKAFSKYVSPDVIEEIVKDPSKLQLGGVRKHIAVLFSDIRGFTTYSEKRKPEEVVSILNEYLDAMTKVVFENKGTLDKYVGDEIMAVFGAPNYESPEISSKRAVISACQMLGKLKELHAKWTKEGLEPLDIGIGINTGEMIVGNMGSELRMDYTVIGDAVNLGARIEALTRQFNAHLIISEATYNYVKDIIDERPLEPIKVKGKNIPVMIYEVLGLKSDKI